MLKFTNISVKKGSKVILENVDLAVPKGSITVLLGKNGSGKSTLLDTVTGSVRYSGKVSLDGADLQDLSPTERAKRIACLPQKLSDSSVTVRNLVSLGRYSSHGVFSSMTDADRKAVRSAMDITSITHLADNPVSSLSGGERQKAYIAMILSSEAEYLIFDEPTTYLDIGASREILSLIRSLVMDHGKTVLAVLHDLNLAVSMSQNICVLHNGKSIFSGSVEDFVRSRVPYDIFGAECVQLDGRVFFT